MAKILNVEKFSDEAVYEKTASRKPIPVYNLSFDYLGGKDVMPIGGWWGPYKGKDPESADFFDEEILKDLKESGINHITVSRDDCVYDKESAEKGYDLAEKYNLGVFIHDTAIANAETNEDLEKRISPYAKRGNVLGYHVFDEPNPSQFSWIEKFYRLYNGLNAGDKVAYTNLYPIYGRTVFERFDIDYKQYLAEFLSKVPVKFLSYDYYPFYFKGEGTGGAPQYFENLSIVRSFAKQYKIPFWVFLQAGGQWQCIKKPSMELYPSREEMFWNMHTSMAYGAKAFQYFTLIQPEEYSYSDNGIDPRRIGLIGVDGKKNVWYSYAVEINQWIRQVSKYMMNAENVCVIPVGDKTNKMIGEEKAEKFRELIKAEGGECVIGGFDYKGKTLLYVVNNSTVESCDLKLSFDKKRALTFITAKHESKLIGKEPEISFNAGDGAIIIVD